MTKDEQLQLACDIIEKMAIGIEWWCDAYPTQSSGADDEMLEEANNFINDIKR
jgi:hypothetical protein